jgi:ribonuclease R
MKHKLKELEKKTTRLSQKERVAQKASRDSVKYKQCEYLIDKLGKIYDGVITSVQEYGMFAEIPENGCEGLIKTSDIGYKNWTPDLKKHCFVEEITGRKIRLGDTIKVIIKLVDLEKKEINLTILDIY